MLQETIAIGAVHKPNIKDFSVFNTLLHSCSEAVIIIFRLHDCHGQIGFIVQKVICFLSLTASCNISTNDYSTVCKIIFHLDLTLFIPAGSFDSRSNELKFNVFFGHFVFSH